jgi:hypothetical protein
MTNISDDDASDDKISDDRTMTESVMTVTKGKYTRHPHLSMQQMDTDESGKRLCRL